MRSEQVQVRRAAQGQQAGLAQDGAIVAMQEFRGHSFQRLSRQRPNATARDRVHGPVLLPGSLGRQPLKTQRVNLVCVKHEQVTGQRSSGRRALPLRADSRGKDWARSNATRAAPSRSTARHAAAPAEKSPPRRPADKRRASPARCGPDPRTRHTRRARQSYSGPRSPTRSCPRVHFLRPSPNGRPSRSEGITCRATAAAVSHHRSYPVR